MLLLITTNNSERGRNATYFYHSCGLTTLAWICLRWSIARTIRKGPNYPKYILYYRKQKVLNHVLSAIGFWFIFKWSGKRAEWAAEKNIFSVVIYFAH